MSAPARHSSDTTSLLGKERAKPFVRLGLVWYVVVLWVIVVLSVRRIAESDIWYHLANARQIVATGRVPVSDSYSFTVADAPLVDYEWLSELVYFAAFQRAGQHGLLLVYVVLIALAYAGVYWLAIRRGAGSMEAAFVTLVGVLLGSYSFGPRMMHFGWLCLVVLVVILDLSEERPVLLWSLPLLFCVWINLHGSWLFGFVVLGASALEGVMDGVWGSVEARRWSRDRMARVLATGLLSAAALFLNPYGWKLPAYPFEFRYKLAPALARVIEWQSVNFHDGYGKLALLMLVGLVMTLWFGRLRWRVRDVVLVLFALWAAMTYVRFLGFASLILIPILAPRVRLRRGRARREESGALNAVLAGAMVMAIVKSVPSRDAIQAHLDREFPRHALGYMSENRLTGRLFNLYDFGGYIAWHAPSIKTFADGRTDIFVYNGTFDDYIRTVEIDGSLGLLERHAIEYVLYPPGSRLSYLLENTERWETAYRDDVAQLFRRTTRQARSMPE